MAHLPKNYQQMNIPDDFINRTAMARIEAKGQTPAQCKMSILTILTQKPLYGACIFTNVSVKTVRSTFTKCWLVISRHGVALHDPHEKEPKHFFTHDQITRVASEKDAFTVISGNLMKDDKWVFTGPDVSRSSLVCELIENRSTVQRMSTDCPSKWMPRTILFLICISFGCAPLYKIHSFRSLLSSYSV